MIIFFHLTGCPPKLDAWGQRPLCPLSARHCVLDLEQISLKIIDVLHYAVL